MNEWGLIDANNNKRYLWNFDTIRIVVMSFACSTFQHCRGWSCISPILITIGSAKKCITLRTIAFIISSFSQTYAISCHDVLIIQENLIFHMQSWIWKHIWKTKNVCVVLKIPSGCNARSCICSQSCLDSGVNALWKTLFPNFTILY